MENANWKGQLQERTQEQGVALPTYVTARVAGGAHDPTFQSTVKALGLTACGQGGSKRKAEHAAASSLLGLTTASSLLTPGMIITSKIAGL